MSSKEHRKSYAKTGIFLKSYAKTGKISEKWTNNAFSCRSGLNSKFKLIVCFVVNKNGVMLHSIRTKISRNNNILKRTLSQSFTVKINVNYMPFKSFVSVLIVLENNKV